MSTPNCFPLNYLEIWPLLFGVSAIQCLLIFRKSQEKKSNQYGFRGNPYKNSGQYGDRLQQHHSCQYADVESISGVENLPDGHGHEKAERKSKPHSRVKFLLNVLIKLVHYLKLSKKNKPSFCSGSCNEIHARTKLQNKTSLNSL